MLGDLVAERTGMPFAEYLCQGVLEPLGMDRTPCCARTAPPGRPPPDWPARWWTWCASGGEWAVPTLVSPETHAQMASVQFPGLAGVLPGFRRFDPCDWGLGVEIRGDKRPHWTGTANAPSTFGHFGQSGSFLWVDPVAGVLCAGLSDRPFGLWAARAWPALADAVLAQCGRAGAGRRSAVSRPSRPSLTPTRGIPPGDRGCPDVRRTGPLGCGP